MRKKIKISNYKFSFSKMMRKNIKDPLKTGKKKHKNWPNKWKNIENKNKRLSKVYISLILMIILISLENYNKKTSFSAIPSNRMNKKTIFYQRIVRK